MRIDVWHNIMWSKYKGLVFSELHRLAEQQAVEIAFFQIAETDNDRVSLAPIDMSYHRYPYTLLFKGSFSKVSALTRALKILYYTAKSSADTVVVAGYDRIEYWLQIFLAVFMGKSVGVFCDSTAYDRSQSRLKSLLKKAIFSFADIVFCYGARSGEYVHSFGVPWQRIKVRCQAAALPRSYDKDQALRRRVAAAEARANPRYVYVGRLSREKNIDVLLVAFHDVVKHFPGASLVIVGDGPARDELMAQTEWLGLRSKVEFLGSKSGDGLVAEYTKATCLVLPSRSEPWGLVVNEALSYGCPVVVSDHCGCVPELVIEGKSGFMFRTGDSVDLSAKLRHLTAEFTDAETVGLRCLEVIAPFTSTEAARSILNGCLSQSGSKDFIRERRGVV